MDIAPRASSVKDEPIVRSFFRRVLWHSAQMQGGDVPVVAAPPPPPQGTVFSIHPISPGTPPQPGFPIFVQAPSQQPEVGMAPPSEVPALMMPAAPPATPPKATIPAMDGGPHQQILIISPPKDVKYCTEEVRANLPHEPVKGDAGGDHCPACPPGTSRDPAVIAGIVPPPKQDGKHGQVAPGGGGSAGSMTGSGEMEDWRMKSRFGIKQMTFDVPDSPPDRFGFKGGKLTTAPFDPRFPHQNQTRYCWISFLDYHRCRRIKGDDYDGCLYFKKCYTAICPPSWVTKWDQQMSEHRFAGQAWIDT